ncbi:MAG: tRNA (adenosine(37)-N6)-dimethylallyltransferase MiaA [Eubacterium coprostanoligenes]|uniref:tRNA (adenosine(37)-N6)-dimethylallyltransferase MiaA n=1 Tax=Eubacterium coprostanoligenes TaxID=290054 RepID=UPI002408F608|nr:tRNA (adenosine(37)-N6)-dimethylallyltransferase MiaA [Eubacterium coprostanoligenes]MDD6664939.1 tRNA (adenosine(37)-N6)-dimethylallyltransferase MiaA [Eubacterium coprostanoligenes]
MEKTKIICVVGATASGKTDLAVKLAKAVDGEIISADSMQVYKNMPIATAVATKEEQDGVVHHLVEFLDADQTFSVADFVERAKVLIDEITARGRVPIVAGGTGLFVDSLVKNISFSQVGSNAEIRNELAEKSNEELFEKLLALDPKSAEDIHPNNRKRVIRALELCMSGTSKTEQNENSMLIDSPYDALYIGIGYQDRQKLYDRINKRVDLMLDAGLENEARQMLGKQGLTARQAIGHKELQPYIDGNITLDEAVEGLKRETRRYAKRQLTWFRRNENINWLYADEMSRDELVEKAVDLAKNHLK